MSVDTACSSGLVAGHYGMRALQHRECTTAVLAGVNMVFGPASNPSQRARTLALALTLANEPEP